MLPEVLAGANENLEKNNFKDRETFELVKKMLMQFRSKVRCQICKHADGMLKSTSQRIPTDLKRGCLTRSRECLFTSTEQM